MQKAPHAEMQLIAADNAAEKENRLRRLMQESRAVLVAYSGGVDSTYLAAIATAELGKFAISVFADSPSVSLYQKTLAENSAKLLGLNLLKIRTLEAEKPEYLRNAPDRCFHCKSELYSRIAVLAQEKGIVVIMDGTNADDLSDYRPGRVAAAEYRIRSPLAEIGFTKDEIRSRSRALDLPSAELPASPCLASRIPYGLSVSAERLSRIEKAEEEIRNLGFKEFRVRHYDGYARVEIAKTELCRAIDHRINGEIKRRLMKHGFSSVRLALDGFRSGSLNSAIG
ncbi:MAG: ATP-dependent sacrificial sulfur transferase LarE [Pyrinomonadaceae bacterium]